MFKNSEYISINKNLPIKNSKKVKSADVMHKISFLITISLICCLASKSQYYYKDIITVKQTSADMAAFKESGIRKIKVKSIEPDGEINKDFFCEKRISKDYKTSFLYTRSNNTGKSLMESYFNNTGQLIKTYDSSEFVVSNCVYQYNNEGQLSKTSYTSRSSDDDFINQIVEEHIYEYNDKNLLSRMYRVKNSKDTITILFSNDEKNNIALEKDTRDGSKYYYYYDANNRLTDVVHASQYKEKLIADYIFEYNSSNQIVKMTTTEEGENGYLVWKYTYDGKLKTNEKIFSRGKKLVGQIQYEYLK